MKKICQECGSEVEVLSFAGWRLNSELRRLTSLEAESIRLSHMEGAIMSELMKVVGRPVETRIILRAMYGRFKPDGARQILRVIVYNLRKKLVGTGIKLSSSHALGYYLEAEEA